MNNPLVALALEFTKQDSGANPIASRCSRVSRRYLQSLAMLSRAEAEFLDSIAADVASANHGWEHVPGPKSLSESEVKAVWDGVNDQAKRLLGAFVTSGGEMAQQDLMDVLGVDEPRLLNGPLGGISRRVKKLLGDSEATFYSIHPETGRYVLQTSTFEALCQLIERERPDLLSILSARTAAAHRGSDLKEENVDE